MNNYLKIGLTWLAFVNAFPLAWDIGLQGKLSDTQIISRVSQFLRWTSFWESRPLQNYREGRRTQIVVVESPKEVASILADIGTNIAFALNGKMLGSSGFPPTTSSAAVDKYIREYGVTSVITREGNNTVITREQKQSMTMEEKKKVLKIHSIQYLLPKLDVPDAIRYRHRSAELPSLKAALPSALKGFYNSGCGLGMMLIPYFSDDDPWVNVFADLGSCGKGIIYCKHDDNSGQWKCGPFWPNKPPDDFSSIIQKIRENVADNIKITP